MSSGRPLKILITGFGPFPGVPRNPAGEAARLLGALRRPALAGMVREVMLLPTEWRALADLDARIATFAPDAVLLLGVAPRRRRVDVEVRAVNCARGADAARRRVPGRKLSAQGREMLATRAAPTSLVHALEAAGLKAGRSRDAGRYLCNGAYYTALARLADTDTPAIFVHLPGKGPVARADRRRLVFALSQLLLALARPAQGGPIMRP
ncbi:peptidase C15 [Aquabacter sp. CN5-332]|uniref:pyroglutamyl-peptidase I family protein n=1 Tax=Aquabacter sp. CN5-332 TaxID=3156608 RepID=UPI0032B5D6F8